MLQNIRENAQGTVAKIIIFLIVVTFALWGVESIIGNMRGEPEVATVNGTSIKEVQYKKAVEQKRRQILQRMGANADPSLIDEALLKKSVLEGLIEEQILLQSAQDKGLVISNALIDQYIRSLPPFQQNGQFNKDVYAATLRSVGMTPGDFRDAIRKEMLIAQDREAVRQSSFVTAAETDQLIKLDRQTRDFNYLLVPASRFVAEVSLTDKEIQDYYASNKEKFKLPERVSLKYVEIKKSDLIAQVSVSDSELQQRYDQEMKNYAGKEERDASHILIEVNKDQTDQQALQKIQDIRKQLVAGADFAELAKKYSQDPGSATQGGHLGFVTKGTYVPAFDDALFKMKPGELSEPVKTEYGYHLIKLLSVRSQEKPTFAEMHDQLMASIRDDKVENLYRDKVDKLSDVAYSALDLEEPAKQLGLKIQETDPFSRDGGTGVFANPHVIRAAFSKEVLDDNNSEPVEVGKDTTLVLHLKQHFDAEDQPLDAVKAQIRDELTKQKSLQLAQDFAQKLMQDVTDSAGLEQVSAKAEAKWNEVKAASRKQASMPAEVVKKAFAMARPKEGSPEMSGVQVGDGEYAIIALKSVTDGDLKSYSATERKTIEDLIGDNEGSREYALETEFLRQKAEIKKL